MLTKNTVSIRYIRLFYDANTGYYLDGDPLTTIYDFYAPQDLRNQLSIGTVIKADTKHYKTKPKHRTVYGVIVDNITERRSRLVHKTLKSWQIHRDGHLRSFLKQQYHLDRDSKITNKIYHRFRYRSHNYWMKYYDKQKG